MTSWTEGYVADIPYALGFYRETVPTHIAFAAAAVGKHPGLSRQPRRALELGFGMGLGFVINAAANPSTHFEGVDFNPLHVAHASGLVDEAELTNVSLREASFQDLARDAREGQHDLDLIVLHGILTWVSAEAHEAIVEIARKRLKPGGMLYVSYNCMPGWASVQPLQRLMRENAKRVAGRSDLQTGSGLELLNNLIAEGANYFKANTGLEQRISRMATVDKNYLAHEYLNANWFIFYFADVAEMFAKAKLGYVGSATIIENNDNFALPEKTRQRVIAEADPIFKETLRDIASNKQFRRDIYSRGVAQLTPAEHNALLNEMRFALAVPRQQVSFKFASPIGELDGNAQIYGAITDLLARGNASFQEICALPSLEQGGANSAIQAVALLVHSGQVFPIGSGGENDKGPAQRLNRVIAKKMLQGRVYNFLAAPTPGSGVQVTPGELLIFAGILAGNEKVEALTAYVVNAMKPLGMNWMKNGEAVSDRAELHELIAVDVTRFLAEKVPLWRHLGVL